jgi:hypothetical protein
MEEPKQISVFMEVGVDFFLRKIQVYASTFGTEGIKQLVEMTP